MWLALLSSEGVWGTEICVRNTKNQSKELENCLLELS